MMRLPAFTRHSGPRRMVHAAAYQNREGRISIRISVPAGSGRVTTIELPMSAARDALAAISEALTDASAALDLICAGETTKPREPGNRRDEDA